MNPYSCLGGMDKYAMILNNWTLNLNIKASWNGDTEKFFA